MKILLPALVCASLLLCVPVTSAQPPAQPAATNRQMLRVVVLPFQNATGDTNRDDWQLALPSLIRANFDSVKFTFVIGREKTRQALKRAGWVAGREVDAKLAGQVALDLGAKIAVWGSLQRQSNQWTLEVQVLNTNSPSGSVHIKITSPDLARLPQQVATNLAGYLDRPISEEDLQYTEKYLSVSEPALKLLARAISLDDQKQPDAEEKVLRQLLAEDPRCGLGHMLLSRIYADTTARSNELAAAVHEFVRQRPDLCAAHLQNAWLFQDELDKAGMKRELLEAMRVHPGCPEGCKGLFMLLGGVNQQWGELQGILEQAHAIRPDDTDITILLAATKAQLGAVDDTDALLADITDLPEENEIVDFALLVASLSPGRIELAGRELTRLGPQAATNENIQHIFASAGVFKRESDDGSSSAPIARPRSFTTEQLNAEMDHRLSTEERTLVENPTAITPEITAEAHRLTIGFTNDTLRSIALLAEVARRGRGEGDGGSRTADQALAQANDPRTRFSCQEFAKLFVALARSLGMESWLVHIDRDANGKPGYHDCAVVYLDGNGILVDPTWRVFGIRHQEFNVLDDLQAISHQAMQPQGRDNPIRLRLGLKLNPTNRWTQLQFVRGMVRVHDFAAAAAELATVQKSGVETWDVHEVAGELEIEREQWRPALAELERANTLSPSNTLVHFQLAQAYVGLGDSVKAAEHMEAALQFDRGEMRRDLSAHVSAMRTILRSETGDAAARAEMQRLAEAGDPTALNYMVKVCFDAEPQQLDEGLGWALKAAKQGDAQTQFEYARNLLLVHPDAGTNVIQWLTRSAKQGYADAQYLLGQLLYYGKIVPGDNVAAGQWILLAAGAGHPDAKFLWKEMEIFLSAGELAEAHKRAADFKPVEEIPARKGK
jgi:tetratricopeptide (TPR) repeat protein